MRQKDPRSVCFTHVRTLEEIDKSKSLKEDEKLNKNGNVDFTFFFYWSRFPLCSVFTKITATLAFKNKK